MNKDIRISVDFFQHHKTKRLNRRLGLEGVISLQKLWCYAAKNRPEGTLSGMDADDISDVSDWSGDANEFVSQLCEIGFLEQCNEGVYQIHDWEENNPWAAGAKERSEQAKQAAMTRWGKQGNRDGNYTKKSTFNADSMREASSEHAEGNAGADADSMPLSFPSPSPSPSPSPEKKGTDVPTAQNMNDEYVAEIKTTDEAKPLRIKRSRAEQWQEKFKFIGVEAELYRLTQWAEQNPEKRWTPKQAFFACSGALGKKNQQALQDMHIRDPSFDPADPDGNKKAQEAKRRTTEMVERLSKIDPYASTC